MQKRSEQKLCLMFDSFLGDGNFHTIIMFKPDDDKELAEAKRLAKDMALRAIGNIK